MIQVLEDFNILLPILVSGLWLATTVVFDLVARAKRRRAVAELRRQCRLHAAEIARLSDAHAMEVALLRDQLRQEGEQPKAFDAIAAVKIERTRLMNRGEYRLWRQLQAILPALPRSVLLFPQVPMGEILHVSRNTGAEALRKRASQDLQAKRIDFVLTDPCGRAVCAIELQGSGHFQGNAAWRDQIKRAIFTKAAVPLIEVYPDHNEADLVARIGAAISRPTPMATAAE